MVETKSVSSHGAQMPSECELPRAIVMPFEAWALEEQPKQVLSKISLAEGGSATIRNVQVEAAMRKREKITINNADDVVAPGEYARNRRELLDAKRGVIEVEVLKLKPPATR
ncbi:alpha-xylosidase [Colletotrichum orchidophilum]|uniref:Alpha-xylosidase n=1 Tax=Colletotrichum orchidophilum TaxID=1209926 RepID=A0A1G4BHY3_9PEZI|nr:alpha-xylosidase [Colletotrichum orchidophilum]OHF00943.1 alpha-xylosidase [Colletotrichum orchidophilum]